MPEGDADERPVTSVFGLVHPHENERAHDELHQLTDRPRREGDVVAQHLSDEVVRVHVDDRGRLAAEVGLHDELERRLPPLGSERGIGVAEIAGHGVGELAHGVEGIVERIHGPCIDS